MRKEILIITLFGMLLLFTGCEDSGDGDSSSTVDPYIGGTEGVYIEFVTGMPPDYIFDNSGYPFSIGIELENVGEHDLLEDQATIEIIGINPQDFGKSSQNDLIKSLDRDIQGAKKNFDGSNIPGENTILEIAELNYQPDLHGNSGIKIIADLCYKYKTYTSTKICIKRDILNNIQDNKICDLSGDKDTLNSAAPLHITSFRETPMGEDRLQLSFEIENVATVQSGLVFKRDTECNDVITNTDRNKVWVEVVTPVNGVYPDCNGLVGGSSSAEGYITLYDGEPRTVTCSLDVSGVDSIFEVPSYQINLEYNYMQSIERPLEIRDVSSG